jgi:oligopeptide/dipeptide ABC transporter ATP-binding protein
MSRPAFTPNIDPARPVLEVDGLHVSFSTERGEWPVVSDVSFSVGAGETVALVGESGCGKSVTALAILGLLVPEGRITRGEARLNGQSLTTLSEAEKEKLRGRRIGMIFQEPMTSLNPVFTVGDQIAEVLIRHLKLDAQAAREETLRLLKKVGIPSPEQRIDQYPHELSGGMKQRVMIAMAIACKPDLLIADEPTTALDVTIQAQILRLLQELQQEMGMAVLLITHNLGVVAHFAKRVVVMYAGQIAEEADTRTLFREPLHPYTRALLNSLPRPGNVGARLESIQGTVPSPAEYPAGCRFCTRCPQVMAHCCGDVPPKRDMPMGSRVACWLYTERTSR